MLSLEEITNNLKNAVEKSGGLDKSVKFDFGDLGKVLINGTNVTNDDEEADCTVGMSLEDFMKMAKGEINPTSAFMSGKLKILGDMTAAMGLQNLLKDFIS